MTGCDDDHCAPGRLRGRDENVTFGFPRHRGCEGGPACGKAFSALVDAVKRDFRAHDPLIQAMALHYHFAAMHPFLDGNGRTARALEALLLQRAGLRGHWQPGSQIATADGSVGSVERYLGLELHDYQLPDGTRFYAPDRVTARNWVEILAASPTSVRGPHVPSLKLDEVDEIDTDIRESAMGMCMGRKADRKKKREKLDGSVIMTSTCHRVNGPMARLIEQAEAGAFPLYTMCAFEVLERCPEERSGPKLDSGYAKCPECSLARRKCQGFRPQLVIVGQ